MTYVTFTTLHGHTVILPTGSFLLHMDASGAGAYVSLLQRKGEYQITVAVFNRLMGLLS